MGMRNYLITFTLESGTAVEVLTTAAHANDAIFQATIGLIADLEAAADADLNKVFNRMCAAAVFHEVSVTVGRV
jgi:diacylglycerol kinase family enzyme